MYRITYQVTINNYRGGTLVFVEQGIDNVVACLNSYVERNTGFKGFFTRNKISNIIVGRTPVPSYMENVSIVRVNGV